jgi:hypothetical protein
VCAFHDPAFTHLGGVGDALFRDLADESVVGERGVAGFAVVAGVEVHHRVFRRRAHLVFRALRSWVPAVEGRAGSPLPKRSQGHAAGVGGDRAFQAAFAVIDW